MKIASLDGEVILHNGNIEVKFFCKKSIRKLLYFHLRISGFGENLLLLSLYKFPFEFVAEMHEV